HIFVLGGLPRALRGPDLEVYSDKRVICLTGHRWPTSRDTLQPAQAYLNRLLAIDDADEASRRRPAWTGPVVPPPDDLAGALVNRLQRWGIPAAHVRRWSTGYLLELEACPWADEHTSGTGGAVVMIHASGAFDFSCLHSHC